jgi:2-polyprenyl-3-methyl-5-hydroxy-6-metoxy-1,4-benzoquinol methylase
MNIIRKDIQYVIHDEIITVIVEPFFSKLTRFLQDYEMHIKKANDIDPKEYDSLPFVYDTCMEDQLKYRRESFKLIGELLGKNKKLNILEIGAWNGWLTHSLGINNNTVTSVDYFVDEVNGLGTRKFYSNPNWTSIQCDIENPELFEAQFDLIIFNHNIQFLSDPTGIIRHYKNLLSKHGKIVLLGMSIFKNVQVRKQAVYDFQDHYTKNHKIDVFFKPCRGYLSDVDLKGLINEGFKIKSYSAYRFRNKLSIFLSSWPKYMYAVYENSKATTQ